MDNRLTERQIKDMEDRFRSLQKILINDFEALLQEVKELRKQITRQEQVLPPTEDLPDFQISQPLMNELPAVLEVKDIQQYLGIGRVQAYGLANSGQFRILKIGKRIKVSKEAFVQWVLKNS